MTYVVPEVFVAGTAAIAEEVNDNFDYVIAGLNASLQADGSVTATAPLLLANGAVGAPSIAFGTDPDTGFYRSGANAAVLVAAGAAVLAWGATGIIVTGGVLLAANDGGALGASGTGFSDLFMASGATINIAAGNWVATHTSGELTVGTGDLRVTSPGVNTASVVTLGATQTLGAKTLTAPALTNYISFPATQSASAGANDLDDYEEGTFTPTFATTGTQPSGVAYGTVSGDYEKIGRMVRTRYRLGLTNKGSGATGNAVMAGLPFACGSPDEPPAATRFSQITLSSGYTSALAEGVAAAATMLFVEVGSAVDAQTVAWSAVSNTFRVYVTYVYRV